MKSIQLFFCFFCKATRNTALYYNDPEVTYHYHTVDGLQVTSKYPLSSRPRSLRAGQRGRLTANLAYKPRVTCCQLDLPGQISTSRTTSHEIIHFRLNLDVFFSPWAIETRGEHDSGSGRDAGFMNNGVTRMDGNRVLLSLIVLRTCPPL